MSSFITDISLALLNETMDITTDSAITKEKVNTAILNLLGQKVVPPLADQKSERLFDYFRIIDNTNEIVKHLTDSNDGWKFICKKDEVSIFKRENNKESGNQYCVKGITEIKAPPIIVRNYIRNVAQVHEWDTLLQEGILTIIGFKCNVFVVKVLETIDNRTVVYYFHYSGRVCVIKQERDFVLVHHWYELDDGSYVLVLIGRCY